LHVAQEDVKDTFGARAGSSSQIALEHISVPVMVAGAPGHGHGDECKHE